MGKRWRRLAERLRQQVIAPPFQPVSIERNQMMFREASTYCHHFKTVIKRITRLMKEYEDMTLSVRALLECRVPRTYAMESDGSVGAELVNGDAFLGSGIDLDQLTLSSQSLHARMSEDIITTLQEWFKSYDGCKALMVALEEMKFECDSRHRTVMSLESRQADFAGKVKKGDRPREAMFTAAAEKIKHKEHKFELSLSEFQNKEEEVNQALRALLSEVQKQTEVISHVFEVLAYAPTDAHRACKAGMMTVTRSSNRLSPPQVNKKSTTTTTTKIEAAPEMEQSNPFLDKKSTVLDNKSNPFLDKKSTVLDKKSTVLDKKSNPFLSDYPNPDLSRLTC